MINLKTAKALSLKIHSQRLARPIEGDETGETSFGGGLSGLNKSHKTSETGSPQSRNHENSVATKAAELDRVANAMKHLKAKPEKAW